MQNPASKQTFVSVFQPAKLSVRLLERRLGIVSEWATIWTRNSDAPGTPVPRHGQPDAGLYLIHDIWAPDYSFRLGSPRPRPHAPGDSRCRVQGAWSTSSHATCSSATSAPSRICAVWPQRTTAWKYSELPEERWLRESIFCSSPRTCRPSGTRSVRLAQPLREPHQVVPLLRRLGPGRVHHNPIRRYHQRQQVCRTRVMIYQRALHSLRYHAPCHFRIAARHHPALPELLAPQLRHPLGLQFLEHRHTPGPLLPWP